jgi:apolipoprotein N-acyltransferase
MTKKNQKSNLVKNENNWIKKILIHLGLVVFASVLFAASHPNLLFEHGLPVLAWFAYIPILVVIRKYGLLACIGWGATYALTAYGLFNYWLAAFHPMAGTVVYSIYMVYLAIVFLFLKLAGIFFPNRAYLVQWLIWLTYEYLRTLGFLGYPYGITGYSQWQVIPLIQIASITGIWGVSALVAFPSFWLAGALNTKNISKNLPRTRTFGSDTNHHEQKKDGDNGFVMFVWFVVEKIKIFFKKEKVSAIIWGVALAAALVFGFVRVNDFSSKVASDNHPTAVIALIQHNTDPWEATKAETYWQIFEAYRKDLTILKRLSDEALLSYPRPQMVVWSETAFVPRIYWHYTYRTDQNYWLLVRDLLEYLSTQDVPFLIGNHDARRDPAKNPNPSRQFQVDYNAAMFFENGINTATYRKLHLVPFTEHFPYQRQFPQIYQALINADTHFWDKGDEETVFSGPGFTFSSPICFEDIFGYLSRNFVRRGADVLVNLSNDAWSNSLPAQNQHLSMAVFRSVENFRPMVRATSSGQTSAINQIGKVTAEAPPFTEAWLNVTIHLVPNITIYTLYGDYLGVFFTLAAVVLLLFGAVWYTIRKRKAMI